MFGFLAPIFGALGGKAAVGAVAKTVAGSLVSGAIASKQQKKNLAFQQAQADQNEERHSDRFVDLVENSQRAGINPLTALRADGASSYQAPILNAPMSSSTFIGNALVDGMNTGFNYDQQKRDEERDNLERDIMKAQLDQLQKANKVRGGEYFGYGIPHAETTTDSTPLPRGPFSRPVLSGSKDNPDNGSDANGDRTSVHLGGLDILPANVSDAERFETRYGDGIVAELTSWGIAAADIANTASYHYRRITDPYYDVLEKAAANALRRATSMSKPKLSYSTNPRRPKTFNSRAY